MRFKSYVSEWEQITIEQAAFPLEYGMNAPAKEFDGVNKYIRITDICEDTNKYLGQPPVSPDGKLEDKYIVSDDDILFARTGASTGKTYLYSKSDGLLYYAGFLIKAHIKPQFDSYFVFSQTHTSKYSKWVKLMSMRSGQPGINSQEYASYSFFAPSYDEQRKISGFLKQIDARIETQSKIIEEIKSIKNGISHKVFNDNKFITTYLPLSQFATLKNGYAFKSTTYIDEGKYKVITIANVTGERYYSLEKYNTINTLPMDIQEHQQLKIGDILISLTGNVGRVSYCSTNDTLLNQRVGLLEIKNKVYTEYLYQVLSSLDFEKTMQSCGQGAAQMNIGKSDIENYLIPIPSSEEMMLKISNLLLKLDEKIEIEKDMLSAYKKQKAYLLRQMFI